MSREWRLIGLPRRGVGSYFYDLRASSSDRPPSFYTWFHPSISRRLFRAPSRSPPPDPFGPSRLPGSLPSSRHHPSESTIAGLPEPPLRSVRRRSQPHDGLLLTRAPRFISPSSRVQGRSPFRGSSHRAARHLRQVALPPCRCRPSASADLATHFPPSYAPASRL